MVIGINHEVNWPWKGASGLNKFLLIFEESLLLWPDMKINRMSLVKKISQGQSQFLNNRGVAERG